MTLIDIIAAVGLTYLGIFLAAGLAFLLILFQDPHDPLF